MVFRKFPTSTVVMIGGEIFVWSGATLTKSSVGLMILTAGQRSSFSAFLVISHATTNLQNTFLANATMSRLLVVSLYAISLQVEQCNSVIEAYDHIKMVLSIIAICIAVITVAIKSFGFESYYDTNNIDCQDGDSAGPDNSSNIDKPYAYEVEDVSHREPCDPDIEIYNSTKNFVHQESNLANSQSHRRHIELQDQQV
ncbi:hypothetical protein G6F42_013237 [Rhizopus arrhizus]|nr:hypothetical protein G6F42_013237 [Rhizopus arrhizus]